MEVIHPLLGKFSLLKKIGHDSFSSIYIGQHSTLQYLVAVKIFNDKSKEENILNSFNITKSIMHPFICQVFDLIKTPKEEDCLIMEYVKGTTLLEFAKSNGPLQEFDIQTIIGQLIIAIDFLHKHQLIHNNLNCENIMIDENKNIRLIDLKFSVSNANLHSAIRGSPGYLAPEVISNKNGGASVDIWSLGIVLYAITYGKLPFSNKNYSLLFHAITTFDPFYPPGDRVSNNLVDLIKKMLVKDPENRISINDIKKHPFFTTDSEGKKYIFNQQRINFFIRDPYSKMIPDMQIVQQMKLELDEQSKAIKEIRSGQKTYNSMTYNILYKNYISCDQLQNYSRSFICSVNNRNDESKADFNVPLALNLDKAKKNEETAKTERIPSMSNYTPVDPRNFGAPGLNRAGTVQTRRFSGANQPPVGLKKAAFCMPPPMPRANRRSSRIERLPQLIVKCEEK